MKQVLICVGIAFVFIGASSAFVGTAAVLADTTGGCSVSAAGADCIRVETVVPFVTADGTAIEAQVNVARDLMFGGTAASLTYAIQSVVDCGDGVEADHLLVGDAEGAGILTVASRLSGAHATASVSGIERSYDGCSDTWTDGAAISATLVIDLTATAKASTSHSTTVTTNDDGSRSVQVAVDSSRPAAGTVNVNGVSIPTINAVIASNTVMVH